MGGGGSGGGGGCRPRSWGVPKHHDFDDFGEFSTTISTILASFRRLFDDFGDFSTGFRRILGVKTRVQKGGLQAPDDGGRGPKTRGGSDLDPGGSRKHEKTTKNTSKTRKTGGKRDNTGVDVKTVGPWSKSSPFGHFVRSLFADFPDLPFQPAGIDLKKREKPRKTTKNHEKPRNPGW